MAATSGEHVSELLGYPISRSLAACCVRLELRPLPSTGITRLQRYYEPLRHPGAPGLSLAGVRLIIPGHASGFPVLRALSLCTCRRHYPGAAEGRTPSLLLARPCQPSPIPRSGRPAHRPFRGLLGVHSRCGLHTRTVTVCRDRYPKASDTSSPPCLLRLLPTGAFAGRGLHPLEKRRLVTAHVERGPFRGSRQALRCAPIVVDQLAKSLNLRCQQSPIRIETAEPRMVADPVRAPGRACRRSSVRRPHAH